MVIWPKETVKVKVDGEQPIYNDKVLVNEAGQKSKSVSQEENHGCLSELASIVG